MISGTIINSDNMFHEVVGYFAVHLPQYAEAYNELVLYISLPLRMDNTAFFRRNVSTIASR